MHNQQGQGQMMPNQGQQEGMFVPPNPFGGMGPFVTNAQAPAGTHAPSLIKRFANWNMCFLCGIDVEEGHTSATCPFEWRKPNHQAGYTRENAAMYMAYGPSTKGQYKMQFPAM